MNVIIKNLGRKTLVVVLVLDLAVSNSTVGRGLELGNL